MTAFAINLDSSMEFEDMKNIQDNKIAFPEDFFKSMKVGEWVKVLAQGEIFSPRTGHECIFADGKIYLFAGTDDDERLNDLYSYCIRRNLWTKVDVKGDKPL